MNIADWYLGSADTWAIAAQILRENGQGQPNVAFGLSIEKFIELFEKFAANDRKMSTSWAHEVAAS